MRTLRNVVSLLCALVLLLSLAPCAFAEGEPADSTPIDETVPVGGGNSYESEGSVTIGGSGAIVVTSTDDNPTATVIISGDLTNGGTVEGDAADSVYIQVDGNLQNDGSIDVNVTGSEDSEAEDGCLDVYGNIVNNDNITITAPELSEIDAWDWEEDGSGGYLENNGTITVKATGGSNDEFPDTARILAEGDIKNNGQITIESSAEADLWAFGSLENWGTISLTGCKVLSIWDDELKDYEDRPGAMLAASDGVTNYNTINITMDEKKETYYGVNYVDDKDMIKESALTGDYNWRSGKDGTEIQLKANDTTNEGHTFYWMVNGQKYKPGDTFTVRSVTSIKEFWERIINNTPIASTNDSGHSEKTEKSGEKIVKYMDGYKVLDADRKELKLEDEYFNVAKTSYNRLIVVFTWQQMAQMAEGEHLFYIVSPDNVETEYTLTIW